ncbi:MAG: Xaa-Pro peptidase family protein [Caldisphaeraceae archaeon]|nr:Xaa-Pro peptidase family protein [Caldisphaeraceae archaeon]
MHNRLRRLKEKLSDKCDAVLIFYAADNQNSSLAYFTGVPQEVSGYLFWKFGSKPRLVVSDYSNAVDSRPWVKPERRKNKEQIYEILAESGADVIGIEERYLNYTFVRKLKKSRKRFVGIDKEIREIRSIKEKSELKIMRKAANITKEAFYLVDEIIRPGIREKDMERAVMDLYLERGDISFRPIIASGRNSMYIHSKPTNKKIKKRETVIVDMGARYKGYCSDFTRTFLIEPKVKQLDMVSRLVEVWLDLKDEVHVGMTGDEMYNLARKKLGRLAKYWPYSLGHGVGLDVHEAPSLGPKGEKLDEGMVFTIEPGLHIPGIGGARFEDTGVLTKKGFVTLTNGF